MQFENLKQYLQQLAERVAQGYRDKTTGYRISKAVKGIARATTTAVLSIILLRDYWKYIEGGRRAGAKQPPRMAMLEFIKRRGIVARDKKIKPRQLAFLIGRKIARDGIMPRPFLKQSVAESGNIMKGINDAIRKDVGYEMKNLKIELYGK